MGAIMTWHQIEREIEAPENQKGRARDLTLSLSLSLCLCFTFIRTMDQNQKEKNNSTLSFGGVSTGGGDYYEAGKLLVVIFC